MLDNLFTDKEKTGANGNGFLEKDFDISVKWTWELRRHTKEYGNQKDPYLEDERDSWNF